MLENISYTQIYEAFEEQARHLTDGSDIFCEITAFETDIFFQIGPVLYPDGSLEANELIIQVENMEKAARLVELAGRGYRVLTSRNRVRPV